MFLISSLCLTETCESLNSIEIVHVCVNRAAQVIGEGNAVEAARD